PPPRHRRLQGDRLRRHGARRLPARRRQRRPLPERGQHHSRIHDDQHVFEDVGSEWRVVRAADRSSDRARDRTSRREAATAYEHVSAIEKVAIANRARREIFDFCGTFVLDSVIFSSIIYIWYEDVGMSLQLVSWWLDGQTST